MNEQQVENLIVEKGKVAPRVVPADVDAAIVSAQYYVFPGTTTTVCRLTLKNGFGVVGESACADPDNFDHEIGRKIAYANAREKIWPLLGYVLRQNLHEGRVTG